MRIGNRMNASAFRDMGTSDVLKVLKLHKPQARAI